MVPSVFFQPLSLMGSSVLLPRITLMVMANSWISYRNHVKNGAEAMDVNVQDPPRSCGDLEGA